MEQRFNIAFCGEFAFRDPKNNQKFSWQYELVNTSENFRYRKFLAFRFKNPIFPRNLNVMAFLQLCIENLPQFYDKYTISTVVLQGHAILSTISYLKLVFRANLFLHWPILTHPAAWSRSFGIPPIPHSLFDFNNFKNTECNRLICLELIFNDKKV